MTNREKEILIKDLSARLPYGVKAQYFDAETGRYETSTIDGIDLTTGLDIIIFQCSLPVDTTKRLTACAVKPYLRPISSMTDEEKEELVKMSTLVNSIALTNVLGDWLNEHHFDFHGLIEKGLALEAPKEMYSDKQKKW